MSEKSLGDPKPEGKISFFVLEFVILLITVLLSLLGYLGIRKPWEDGIHRGAVTLQPTCGSPGQSRDADGSFPP